jgi:hypothetical protein
MARIHWRVKSVSRTGKIRVILFIAILFVFLIILLRKPTHKITRSLIPKPDKITDVIISDIPHVLQKPDYCGEACLEMFLKKSGSKLTQDDVFVASGLSIDLHRGCYTPELVTACKKLGFAPGPVWNHFFGGASDADIEPYWWDVYGYLKQDIATIVCMYYDDQPETTEHFRLITGYDAKNDEVIYHEPAEENGAYRRISRKKFMKLWRLKTGINVESLIYFVLQKMEK